MWAGGNAKARLSSRKQQGDRRQVRAPLLNSRPQPPIIPASRPSLSRFPAGRLSIRFCTSLRPPSRAHAKHGPHAAERAVHLGTRREAAWAREPGRWGGQDSKTARCVLRRGNLQPEIRKNNVRSAAESHPKRGKLMCGPKDLKTSHQNTRDAHVCGVWTRGPTSRFVVCGLEDPQADFPKSSM